MPTKRTFLLFCVIAIILSCGACKKQESKYPDFRVEDTAVQTILNENRAEKVLNNLSFVSEHSRLHNLGSLRNH